MYLVRRHSGNSFDALHLIVVVVGGGIAGVVSVAVWLGQ